MIRESVQSSNIKAIGYNPSSCILEIEFKKSGVYQYKDVPKDVYQDFINATSHGSYFHRHIKGRYSYIKLK